MVARDCPRCHGGKYNEGVGFVPPKKPKPTLRQVNVMSTTRTIHYKCNNCGFTDKVPY